MLLAQQLSYLHVLFHILRTSSCVAAVQLGVDATSTGGAPAASATALLENNYRANLEATIPSPLVDPHQESTTSVVVAEAWAHVDQSRARAEMLSVFRGQWDNGMVPTVRFAPGYEGDFLGGSFLPGPGGWGGGGGGGNASSAQSAGGANTSTLAALPLHAEAALRIFDLSARDAEARLWLQSLFPPLFRYHDYLHGSRSCAETGLVYIYHPWEAEVSADSPLWPPLLRETRERAANESWLPPPIPPAVSSVPGFPGQEAFDAAAFLSECSARFGFVDQEVQRGCPFLVQDVQFNAALVRSDKALLELAGILEATRSGWQSKVYTPEQFERLQAWAARAESGAAMKHLWSPGEGSFLQRYTSTTTNESFFARPSTSAGFSALLSPGLERFKEDSVVDTLFSPGEVSFRCGDHPVVDLECGYSGNGSRGGAVADVAVGAGAGRDGGVTVTGERSVQGGGAAVLFSPLAELPARGRAGEAGAGTGVGGAAGRGALQSPDGNAGIGGGGRGPGEEDRPAAAAAAAAAERRVWVLHNFLAVRGFHRHQLDGIAAWLANSTLSLLSPTPQNDDDDDDGDGLSGGGCGGNRSAIDCGDFRFHRAFDGDSGLPLPGPEGNCSSLAASVWVLLLIGDEPDGGNDFPPITHATLFVLVAVELAFSFAMGVSCLIFSVNLVRKLSEEDQPPYRDGGNGSGGGGGGGGGGGEYTGPSVGRAKTNTEDYSRLGGDEEAESGHRGPRSGPTGPAASATTAAEFARTRGIGSLLSRNAGSRLDRYYDDSDEEYWEAATAVAMTTSNGPKLRDNGDWSSEGSSVEGGSDFHDDDADADDYDRAHRQSSRRRRRRAGGSGGDIGRGQQYHQASSGSGGEREWGVQEIPRPRGAAAAARGVRRRGGATAANEGNGQSPTTPAGADGRDNDNGGSGSGGSAGFVDVLRPFYAYFKFW